MDNFSKRFEQSGGSLYELKLEKQDGQDGGGKDKLNLSPRSKNWKQKFLEMQSECKNLKAENIKLKKKIKDLESN